MADKIQLTIVAPDRTLFTGTVEEVYAPGVLGEFGILTGHAPYFTETDTGEVRFKTGGQDRYAAVAEGFAEIAADRVTLLVEAAEYPEEIDVERAREYLKKANDKIAGMTLFDAEYGFRDLRVRRAQNRLAVAKRAPSKV